MLFSNKVNTPSRYYTRSKNNFTLKVDTKVTKVNSFYLNFNEATDFVNISSKPNLNLYLNSKPLKFNYFIIKSNIYI